MEESFRDLLLRYRARTGLTQRDLAARLGVSRRTLQDWEAGINHPGAERLQALIWVLLEAGGLTAGQEATEAQELWAAVLHGTPRMRTPFDPVWLDRLLAEGAAPRDAPSLSPQEALPAAPEVSLAAAGSTERGQDWGEAPDVRGFVGRTEELARLRGWLLAERCRLVAVLGMGGIGKTSLAAKLAQEVARRFERVYWRNLRDAPLPSEWLTGVIGFLSNQQVVPPAADSEQLTALLQLLRARRCLLVLDNFDTLFERGQAEGRYRKDLAGYGRLLQAVGEATHQSCLVVTSREAPAELAVLGGEAVRVLRLQGLGVMEARSLLGHRALRGDDAAWRGLVEHYGGNPLALKVVSQVIADLFGGTISPFLVQVTETFGAVFGGMRRLLDEQFARLSPLEQTVLFWLAVAREPVRLAGLLAPLGPRVGRGGVLEALEALRRRSLVERVEAAGAAAFTLQSVVLEYVTDRLVAAVVEEIVRGEPVLLVEQALVQAQTRDYVRQSQDRLIGAHILEQLKARLGREETERRLLALLEGWRGRPDVEQGYGPGKVVNLLRLLRGDLRGLDLSRLAIRQAYLAEVDAQDASLAGAHLVETVLAEAFDFPASLALSADGALLAAGTSTGEVWLWRVADRTLLAMLQGHTGVIQGVALSADGRLLASGGFDGTVRVWDTGSGRLLETLQDQTAGVWGVALSADGHLLASGGADGVLRLWDTYTGRMLTTLQGHTGPIWSLTLLPDGQLLASGGMDGTVRLWETSTGRLVATLEGHTGGVWSVALSANGQLLASGDEAGTVRVWDANTRRLLATLQGHVGLVWGLGLTGDGRMLASAGFDSTVKLWDVPSGRLLVNLQAHTGVVWCLALTTDGRLLVSGGDDGTVRLWETSTGQLLATLQGQTGGIWGLALSADGHLLASGGADRTVRLWDANTGRMLTTLQGHTGPIWSMALLPDGRLLASAGKDGTVRLWELPSGRSQAVLQGHRGGVCSVALSANGHLVASGGEDRTVRLWEANTGRLLAILQGHTGSVWGLALAADGRMLTSSCTDGLLQLRELPSGRLLATSQEHGGVIWSVAMSRDGRLLASGSEDGTVQLWELPGMHLLATLEGHTSGVYTLAFTPAGELLASSGTDGKVQLWDGRTGQPLATLRGHMGVVRGVALSADGRLVVSGGWDGTVRVWEAQSGTCLRTLRAERRYERMDITGLTGITEAQRRALLALGAVEQQAGPAGSKSLIPSASLSQRPPMGSK